MINEYFLTACSPQILIVFLLVVFLVYQFLRALHLVHFVGSYWFLVLPAIHLRRFARPTALSPEPQFACWDHKCLSHGLSAGVHMDSIKPSIIHVAHVLGNVALLTANMKKFCCLSRMSASVSVVFRVYVIT